MQQEISFTNLQYCITPLQIWFDENEGAVVAFAKYVEGKKMADGKGTENTIDFRKMLMPSWIFHLRAIQLYSSMYSY